MAADNPLWDAERLRGELGEAGVARHQGHHPDLSSRRPCPAAARADVGDLPAQPRPGHLGLRLPPALRVLRRRARLTPRGPVGWPATATTRPPRCGPMQRHASPSSTLARTDADDSSDISPASLLSRPARPAPPWIDPATARLPRRTGAATPAELIATGPCGPPRSRARPRAVRARP